VIDKTKVDLLTSQVKGKRDELTRAEATAQALATQKAGLDAEAAGLGVAPDQLAGEVARLDQVIDGGVAELEGLLAAMNQPAAGAA
jgi:hypothetical protein